MSKQNAYNREELLQCSRGELFGPGNAQLPAPNMLMIDRITHISDTGGKYGKGEIVAELDIHPDLWFFACHFEGDPVMPGCLGLDAMWQLVGFFLAATGGEGKGRALGSGEVKFSGQVLPTNKLVRYHLDIKRVIRRKLTMAIADAAAFFSQWAWSIRTASKLARATSTQRGSVVEWRAIIPGGWRKIRPLASPLCPDPMEAPQNVPGRGERSARSQDCPFRPPPT